MTLRDARFTLAWLVFALCLAIGLTVWAQQPVTVTNAATDYAEDAVHASGDTGPAIQSRRIDAAASSAGASGDYATVNTDALGLLWARFIDPCSGVGKVSVPINIATAATTEIINGTGASNFAYICSVNIGPTAGAQNIALVEDDTDNCASPTAGMAGGTTAGSGWNIATNGGVAFGSGLGTIARTAAVNRFVCFITSAAVQTSGVLTYALATGP